VGFGVFDAGRLTDRQTRQTGDEVKSHFSKFCYPAKKLGSV